MFIFHSASAQGPSINASFPGSTTSPTVKSQMWFNDGTWWGAFSDSSSGIYFYQKVGNNFEKGSLIDSNVLGIPDTLWDGTNLFVLVFEETLQAKLYKYSYSAPTYVLEPGFPVTLPMIGLPSSAVITKDSTGKLWSPIPVLTLVQGATARSMLSGPLQLITLRGTPLEWFSKRVRPQTILRFLR
jgi:hypothetical protein